MLKEDPKNVVKPMEIRPTEADYAWARNYRAHVGHYGQEIETLAGKLAEVRSEAIDTCARLFEGPAAFNWLCMDHGGEEAERIVKMIRALGTSQRRSTE